MKHVFICCDGTWNAPTDLHDGVPVPTNVAKIYSALTGHSGATQQVGYYHPGIGAEATWLRRIWEGATGQGIDEQIQSAYKFLTAHIDGDDRAFLIGFSRGAYTVRSLAGMLYRIGLLQGASWPEVAEAYSIYRLGPTPAAATRLAQLKSRAGGRLRDFAVYFIGVWDTVGSLGIPIPKRTSWLVRGLRNRQFHDVALSPTVEYAYHALAIDEQRASFSPTLWELSARRSPSQRVEQVWFPGVHADVGGGYREIGLSDSAFEWMATQLSAAGAGLNTGLTGQVRPDSLGVLHDSFRGLFSLFGSEPRPVPSLWPGAVPPVTQSVSVTAHQRFALAPIAQSPYRVTLKLSVGQDVSLSVYAQQPWNWTGVFVNPGETYQVTASPASSWKDLGIVCDARGYRRWWLAPFGWMRRVPDANWFCLCAALANQHNPSVSGVPAHPSLFAIGMTGHVTATEGGYLYLFANDAENMYFNNRGSVLVTVKRTA